MDARVKPGHDDADGISQAVIAGLDPAIHLRGIEASKDPSVIPV